jgi:hypothetical protein
MVFDVELLNLVLYCMQQLGIALGLGAQTIMLVAYVTAMRDGIIDKTEAQFLRATRRTLWVSLTLILVSGLVITALHALAGQAATVMMPAYLFKMLLIAAVVLLTALLHTLPETFAEGLLGGTWYALFMVHILAPVTTWANLLTLLAVWMAGFMLVWYAIVFSTRERKAATKAVKSSEAVILQKSAPQPAKPTPVRKPLFSFFKRPAKPVAEVPSVVVPPMPPVTLVTPAAPVQLPRIQLDPVPKIAPMVTPKPVALPIEKSPAAIATDTPFLPQVPPLQPIPTIPPTPGSAPLPPMPPASDGSKQPPVLQKPVDLPPTVPAILPEIRLGLHVMPKSPDQLK